MFEVDNRRESNVDEIEPSLLLKNMIPQLVERAKRFISSTNETHEKINRVE
jgi:hypothetical protein